MQLTELRVHVYAGFYCMCTCSFMANKITCKISGGQDVDIEHVKDVVQSDNYLLALSAMLISLKDCVNKSLSELVEKERTVHANSNRCSRKDTSASSDSGTACKHHTCLS